MKTLINIEELNGDCLIEYGGRLFKANGWSVPGVGEELKITFSELQNTYLSDNYVPPKEETK